MTVDGRADGRRAHQRELAAFLRARRERTDPLDLGLPLTGRRRTPGLRREEVAQLAGMSVDYYTRLEQARDLQPSAAVLDSIARTLRLDPAERDHLFRLGGTEPSPRRSWPVPLVRPSVRRVLDAVEPNPAFVTGRRLEVLAWNRPCAALVVDFAALPPPMRNIAAMVFLDPRSRDIYPDWEDVARDVVAVLHGALGHHPADQETLALVDRLSEHPRFRALWARHDIRGRTTGTKAFAHPTLGRFTLDYEAMGLGDSDHTLIVYTAPAGSDAQARIDLLAGMPPRAWAGSGSGVGGPAPE